MGNTNISDTQAKVFRLEGFAEAWEDTHFQMGRRIWLATKKQRVIKNHNGSYCPAGGRPVVLGGSKSCHECETDYLDAVSVFTRKQRLSRGRG